MVPNDVKLIPGQKKRLEAVRNFVKTKALSGPIYLTEALMEAEPDRTMIFMAIDGHVLNGGSPMVDPGEAIEQPAVRIMSIDETRSIRIKERSKQRIPGTNRHETVTQHKSLGTDATVRHTDARELLYKYGHPVLDWRSKGGKKGHIVEVAWLEAEVKKPDCLPEFVELWETLQPRILKGGAAPKSADDQQHKTKGKALS